MKPLNSLFYVLSALCFMVLAACEEDTPATPPPADLLGNWSLTGARTTINGSTDIRRAFQEYFDNQGNPLSEQELDEIAAILREPVTGLLNDSTTLAFRADSYAAFDDHHTNYEGGLEFQNNNQLILADVSEPIHLTISTLTDAQLVLLLDPEDYFDRWFYPERPGGIVLEYTFTKQ